MQYIVYGTLLAIAVWLAVEILTHVLDEFRFKRDNKQS